MQPTMFCHDGTTIYYPTGPGRVHMITIAALADCDGSDEDMSDSTTIDGVFLMCDAACTAGLLIAVEMGVAPLKWPTVYHEAAGDIIGAPDMEATAADFHDVLELWADWCDRDAARLDSLEGPAPDEEAEGILARLRKVMSTSYGRATVTGLLDAAESGRAA